MPRPVVLIVQPVQPVTFTPHPSIAPPVHAHMNADRPPRRSAHICESCRQRKVRCDGTSPPCSNCERLSLRCTYSSAEASFPPHQRLRAQRACQQCRHRKRRCDGDLPDCRSCKSSMLSCVYPQERKRRCRPLRPVQERGSTASNAPGTERAAIPSSARYVPLWCIGRAGTDSQIAAKPQSLTFP